MAPPSKSTNTASAQGRPLEVRTEPGGGLCVGLASVVILIGLIPTALAALEDKTTPISSSAADEDPSLIQKVGSTLSDLVEGNGSSQTWDTESSNSDVAVMGANDLGVDDRVGTGTEIKEDADAAEAERQRLGVQFTFSATKSTWDFWWKDGYYFIENRDEYQLKSPLLDEIAREKPRFRAMIGARISGDAAVYGSSDLESYEFDNGFEVRRAKLYMVGEYVLGAPTAYKVQFGFEGGQFYLSDFFFRIEDRPVFGNIQLGNFKAPFSPAILTSSWDYPLMEYPAPVEAFAPGFKTGYQSDWYFEKARVLVAAGLFTDIGTNNIGDATDSLGRLNARVVWRPVVLGEGRDRQFLHLGLSLGWVFSDDDIRYRSRPESYLAPHLVDTGPIDAGDAAMLGLEAIWSRGPLSMMGEVILSQVQDRTLGQDLLFGGAYLSAHYILTGEVWPYDPKIGTFRSIKPARPFRFRNGGPGAWEVSLRASILDLNDKSVRGGQMDILMAGLNWHWNKHSKWMLNGGVAETDEVSGSGRVLIGQIRYQLRY